MSWEQASYIVATLIGLGTILGFLWRFWPHITKFFKVVPRKTIVLVGDNSEQTNYWYLVTAEGKPPTIQIAGRFMATNITDRPVALAKAMLKGIQGEVIQSMITVKHPNSQYYGQYDIPAGNRTVVSVLFFIVPKQIPKAGSLIKLDIAVIDQFGNSHWIKKAPFKAT